MTADLGGQVAIVTGSTGYIGSCIAGVLANRGAAVVVHGRQAQPVAAAVAHLERQGATVFGVYGDVAQPSTADALVEGALRRFGRLDILVNNAGMTATYGDLLTYADAAIEDVLRVNLVGPILTSRAAARQMVAQAQGGSIVNITSVGGSQRAHHGNAIYDVAKGGLDALTRALATDLGPVGIRVNAVGPAEIAPSPPSLRGQDLPLRRGGTGDDVAQAVAYLVSPAAAFVTGQILYVDGGLMAQLRSPTTDQAAANS